MVSLRKISAQTLTALLIFNIAFSPLAAHADREQDYNYTADQGGSGTGYTTSGGTGTGGNNLSPETLQEIGLLEQAKYELLSQKSQIEIQLISASGDAKRDLTTARADIIKELQTVEQEIAALKNGSAVVQFGCESACRAQKQTALKILGGKLCDEKDEFCKSCKMAFIGTSSVEENGSQIAATGRQGDLGQRCLSYEETLVSIKRSKRANTLYGITAAVCGVGLILAGLAQIWATLEPVAKVAGLVCGAAGLASAGYDIVVALKESASSNKEVEAAMGALGAVSGVGALVNKANIQALGGMLGDAKAKAASVKSGATSKTMLIPMGITAVTYGFKFKVGKDAKKEMEKVKDSTCSGIETMLVASRNSESRQISCINRYALLEKYKDQGDGATTGPGTGPGGDTTPDGKSEVAGLGSGGSPEGGNGSSVGPLYGEMNNAGIEPVSIDGDTAKDPGMVQRIEQLNNAIKDAMKVPGYKELMSELGPKVLGSLSEGKGFSGVADALGGGLTPEQQNTLSNFDKNLNDLAKQNAEKFKDGATFSDSALGALKTGGEKSNANSNSGFGDWGGNEGGGSLIGDLTFGSNANRAPASDADADSIHLSQNRSIFKIVSDRIAVKAKDKAVLSAQDAKAAAAAAQLKNRSRLPASRRGKSKAAGTF